MPSVREAILAELKRLYEAKGPQAHILAENLSAYGPDVGEFRTALNQLLAEKLISGVTIDGGRVAVALAPSAYGSLERPPGSNIVTVSIGQGGQLVGNVVTGIGSTQTANVRAGSSGHDLQERISELQQLVEKLVAGLPSETDKIDVRAQAETFVAEAQKPIPSKKLLSITGEGLLGAAKTVATLAYPVTKAVEAIIHIVSP